MLSGRARKRCGDARTAAFLHERGHDIQHSADYPRPREQLTRTVATCLAHSTSEIWLCQECEQSIRKASHVVNRNGEAGLPVRDDLRDGPGLRTDAGQAEVHRFHEGDAKGLEPRREREYVSR